MTPNEEPYYRHSQDTPMRPHSRAESAPDHPLPMPWRPTLAPRNQLIHSPTALSPTTSPPPQARSPLEEHPHHQKSKKPSFKEPLVSPLSLTKPFKRKGSLNPIRQKSASMGGKQHLSGSVDAQLHLRGLSHPPTPHGMSAAVHPAQALSRHHSVDPRGHVPIGWSGSNSFHGHSKGSGSAAASIQSLMRHGHQPQSPYTSVQDDMHALADGGSNTSVAIKQELFAMPVSGNSTPSPQGPSPQASVGPSHAHFKSGENLKVDPISGGEMPHKRHHPYTNHTHSHTHSNHHNRSISAKPLRPQSMYEGLPPELSTSAGHMTHIGPEHHNYFNGTHEHGLEVRNFS